MIQTKIDILWLRQCCALHLQYFPDTPLLTKFCDLQNRIEQDSTAPLLHVLPKSLHMRVATLMDARSQFKVSNHGLWKMEGARCRDIIEKLVEKTRPIDLEFTELATSEAAVFIKHKNHQNCTNCVRRSHIPSASKIGYRDRPPI